MNLGPQLAAAAGMMVLMTLVHAVGVVLITKMFGLERPSDGAHRLDLAAFALLTSIGLSIFALHTIEIGLFALFYMAIGAIPNPEQALFFSASAYTTLGQPEVSFPVAWRLVGAIEGLVGFILIGWSTAVFITDMNKLLRD